MHKKWHLEGLRLDAEDPLSAFRARFVPTDEPGLVYLDGNSLGRMPIGAQERIGGATNREWPHRLVRGWNEAWYSLPKTIGNKIGQVIGADQDSVLVCDSTSINLYKLAHAALSSRPGKIVTDDLNFPTDLYILQGLAHQFGREVVVIRSPDGIHIPPELYEKELEGAALLSTSLVEFMSGFRHDAERLTASAHRAGALALWDLSHAAGAIPLEIARWNIDLAIGCTYKYLNGGPGSPAYLYVHPQLQSELTQPIWGWFGQEKPFAFDLDYEPAKGMARFSVGTPPILSLVAIEAGVDLLLKAGIDRLWSKSVAQSEFLVRMIHETLPEFEIVSPFDSSARGSHISLSHPQAHAIVRKLIADFQVIPDFRAPNCLRIGIAPLYTSYEELVTCAESLRKILDQGNLDETGLDLDAVT